MTALLEQATDPARIWIASNREFVAQPDASLPKDRHLPTARRAPTLSLGMVEVDIPRHHRRGLIELPTPFALSSSQERFAIRSIDVSNCEIEPHLIDMSPSLVAQSFLTLTQRYSEDWHDHRGFVFVHGYNETFEHTVFTAAQMHRDLGFKGTPLAFCWPSAGTYQGYTYDQESLQISRQYLLQFFEAILELGLNDISIVAHSLGARLVLEALALLKLKIAANMWRPRDYAGSLFREVIFCHPDISMTEFRLQMRTIEDSRFEQLADRFSLLVNPTDKALGVSAPFHGSEELRLGSALQTFSAPSCEVIHLGSLHVSSMDWGHNLYRDNEAGLTILGCLLRHEPLASCARLSALGSKSWLAI